MPSGNIFLQTELIRIRILVELLASLGINEPENALYKELSQRNTRTRIHTAHHSPALIISFYFCVSGLYFALHPIHLNSLFLYQTILRLSICLSVNHSERRQRRKAAECYWAEISHVSCPTFTQLLNIDNWSTCLAGCYQITHRHTHTVNVLLHLCFIT